MSVFSVVSWLEHPRVDKHQPLAVVTSMLLNTPICQVANRVTKARCLWPIQARQDKHSPKPIAPSYNVVKPWLFGRHVASTNKKQSCQAGGELPKFANLHAQNCTFHSLPIIQQGFDNNSILLWLAYFLIIFTTTVVLIILIIIVNIIIIISALSCQEKSVAVGWHRLGPQAAVC